MRDLNPSSDKDLVASDSTNQMTYGVQLPTLKTKVENGCVEMKGKQNYLRIIWQRYFKKCHPIERSLSTSTTCVKFGYLQIAKIIDKHINPKKATGIYEISSAILKLSPKTVLFITYFYRCICFNGWRDVPPQDVSGIIILEGQAIFNRVSNRPNIF